MIYKFKNLYFLLLKTIKLFSFELLELIDFFLNFTINSFGEDNLSFLINKF